MYNPPRLARDPSITCDSESAWHSLLTGSIILFIIFGIAFPVGSGAIVQGASDSTRREDEQFRVKFGVLYAAFDAEHWWWYVVAVTLRRTLLQLLAVAVERNPITLAILAITTHAVYGGALLACRPYLDPAEDVNAQGSSQFTDLDVLALLHCTIQIIVLALGMAANSDNQTLITVAVAILFLVGTVASAWVFKRVKQRNKQRSQVQLMTVKTAAQDGF